MEEISVTEEDLEYLTDIPMAVCEDAVPYNKSNFSFEEEAKGCITLEAFSSMWDESIRRLIPNP